MKKYELLKNYPIVTSDGFTLYEMREIEDFSQVEKGNLGGFIETEATFSDAYPVNIEDHTSLKNK